MKIRIEELKNKHNTLVRASLSTIYGGSGNNCNDDDEEEESSTGTPQTVGYNLTSGTAV